MAVLFSNIFYVVFCVLYVIVWYMYLLILARTPEKAIVIPVSFLSWLNKGYIYIYTFFIQARTYPEKIYLHVYLHYSFLKARLALHYGFIFQVLSDQGIQLCNILHSLSTQVTHPRAHQALMYHSLISCL